MEIAALVEPLENKGYRMTSLVPSRLIAEAPTREEALDQLRTLLHRQFSHAEIVVLHVPIAGEVLPWKALAGTWKNHPDAAEFENRLQEYRRQLDEDANQP
jgi:hypothetical protein